jgi:hypothetical protein
MLGCLNPHAKDISLKKDVSCLALNVGRTLTATIDLNHLARLTTPKEPLSTALPSLMDLLGIL